MYFQATKAIRAEQAVTRTLETSRALGSTESGTRHDFLSSEKEFPQEFSRICCNYSYMI